MIYIIASIGIMVSTVIAIVTIEQRKSLYIQMAIEQKSHGSLLKNSTDLKR